MLLLDEIMDKLKDVITEHVEKSVDFLDNTDNKDTQDCLNDNNPLSDDSIGQLTYKLNCVCIQMWHNQEFLYAVRKMTKEEFVEKYGSDLHDLHRMIKRCCDLNYQRSLLMDAIDKKATEIASGYSR